MRYFRCLQALLLLSALTACVEAFDVATGQGEGMGQAVLLSRSSASELLSVPSGGIRPGEGKVDIGFIRRFEMKDLDELFVATAYRVRNFTAAMGISQFGYSELYSEKTGRLTVAYHYDSLTVGVSLGGMLACFGGSYGRLGATTIGGGLSYRTRRIIGAIVCDNLNSPRLDDNSEGFNPKYSAYTELIGPGLYSLIGRVTLEDMEKPQFAVGQKIEVSALGSFFWGVSTVPVKYGGGVQVNYRGSRLSYATSYHPVLGFSHAVAFSHYFGSDATRE